MNNLSVGVRSVFSDVNCLSKLLTSFLCFCKYSQNLNTRIRIHKLCSRHEIIGGNLCNFSTQQDCWKIKKVGGNFDEICSSFFCATVNNQTSDIRPTKFCHQTISIKSSNVRFRSRK